MTAPTRIDGRFAVVRWLCLVVGLVLTARLVQVQVVQHDSWRDEARRQWLQSRVVPARRGDMVDRAARPLALTVTSYRVGLSGSLVRDRAELAEALAEVFGGTANRRLAELKALRRGLQGAGRAGTPRRRPTATPGPIP